ncbi:alpha-2-macroglobulin family protein [soil metagenome]
MRRSALVLTLLALSLLPNSNSFSKPTAKPETPLATATVSSTWVEADKLISEQKFQAALDKTKEVLNDAKKSGNARLWTEAQIRSSQLQLGLHGYETAVRDLKDQKWPEDPAGRVLLNLYYGFSLMSYQQMYGWEIGQREKTVSSEKVDLKAWTTSQIGEEISRNFDDIMKNAPALNQPAPEFFDAYIEKNNYPKGVRPLLRDIVVYMAVRHLSNSQFWTPRESAEVYKNNVEALTVKTPTTRLGATDQAHHPIEKVASWLGEHALVHQKAGRTEAALEARYQLLLSLHSMMAEPNDRAVILKAMKSLQEKNRGVTWWSMGQWHLAEFIRAEGRPGRLIDARIEAAAGVKAYPESIGGKACAVTVFQIDQPSYTVTAMGSDDAGKRSVLLSYKNLRKMYFRAYPFDLDANLHRPRNGGNLFSLDNVRKEYLENRMKPVAEWSVDLQPTADFSYHRKFVTAPMKKNGIYIIVASSRADFSGKNDVVQAFPFNITDLVLATVSNQEKGVEARSMSGDKGAVVAGAEVTLYRFTWDRPPEKMETKPSGKDGYVHFTEPAKAKTEYFQYFLIAKKDDSIAVELDRLYFDSSGRTTKASASFVYTDRSIYRPGQKLFWKVAAYTGNPDAGIYTAAVKGSEVSVRLLDPNNQTVETKSVKVGEFGTASGEFTIASGRPLGAWMVQSVGSSPGMANVRVEEYKRPTFEANFKDAEQPLRLNRKAKLTGEAKYYFGQPVSAGVVAWRVTREENYPSWWSWGGWGRGRRSYGRGGSAETIANGASPMKPDGTFDLEFTPSADERKAAKESGVTYRFSVEANVTDEGGETRTASRSFRLGFVSVEADLTWSEPYFKVDDAASINANLHNLDGKGKSGNGKYRIFKLKQPLTASVPSELPRDGASSGDNYDESDGEGDSEKFGTIDDKKRARWETDFNWQSISNTWSDGEELASGSLKHNDHGLAEIKLKPFKDSGVYRIQYETTDDFGAKYKMSKTFLVAAVKTQLSVPLVFLAEKSSVEVGGRAKFFIHSGLPNQTFQIETFRAGKRIGRRTWSAGKDSDFFEVPITKEDRGGFTISVQGLRDDQFLRSELTTVVPWTDKTLSLEYSTFRDKLRPGATETFKITVKNPDKRAVASGTAEVLAYMYDRSLDVFGPHSYPSVFSLYPMRYGAVGWNTTLSRVGGQAWNGNWDTGPRAEYLREDALKFHSNYGIGGPGRRGYGGGYGGGPMMSKSSLSDDRASELGSAAPMSAPSTIARAEKKSVPKPAEPQQKDAATALEAPQELRSNFSETAFFKPHLISGKNGIVSFEFTVPDSVTSWNVYAHALTKDMHGGSVQKETKSVKDLMVRPYAPRFLREGDEAEVKVSVNNASDAVMNGVLEFDIENPDTGKSVVADFGLKPGDLKKTFSAPKQGSVTLGFLLKAPRGVANYAFKVTAKSGNLSDGERRPFPVLPSRMHLAQSRFTSLKGKTKKILEFNDLAAGDDPTLLNEKMVVTVDAQLFYGVLQALPYLVTYPYECVEQTLNRFLATGVVTSVFEKYPSVAKMAKEMSARKTQFEKFDEQDANRRMTLEESPWLESAKGGASDSNDLVRVLDSRIAKEERERALTRLKKMQLPSGAFPWFEGGQPDQYMTLYVLMGFGRAMEFKVDVPKEPIMKAWSYTRVWLDEHIEEMMAHNCCWETITSINYAASLYPDASWTAGRFDDAYRKKLLDYSFAHWKEHSPLLKGYLALTLHRMKRPADAKLVWDSVMDSSKSDDQLGTYWAQEDRSWLWYNDTIETHAFSLRALMELEPKDKRSDGLVQWLFLNKKLNHWKSTRATSEAIYALVHYLDATKTLGIREVVKVDAGTQKTEFVFEPEAYTGKKNQMVIPGDKVNAKTTSKITIEKTTEGFAFASATWHFSTDRLPKEDSGDFFNVSRKYFKREMGSNAAGAQEWTLKPLAEGQKIEVGDQIEVQISLRTKHEVEYVHLRDPRAAGLEPENVVSGYRWDLGLTWFEETRDSGSNFFFARLPVGEYTFKYRLRANMAGTFRVGPATVQSMYAPEFNAYSSGYVMKVDAAKKSAAK